MKRLLVLTLLVTGVFIAEINCQMTVPRVVVQEILDYGGSYPDNVIYPEEGTIEFRAWITARPDFVITEEDPHCYADLMKSGVFAVRFNLGNFPGLTGVTEDWRAGEVVRIEVTHIPTGHIAVTEFDIDDGLSPIFRVEEKAIVLEEKQLQHDQELYNDSE